MPAEGTADSCEMRGACIAGRLQWKLHWICWLIASDLWAVFELNCKQGIDILPLHSEIFECTHVVKNDCAGKPLKALAQDTFIQFAEAFAAAASPRAVGGADSGAGSTLHSGDNIRADLKYQQVLAIVSVSRTCVSAKGVPSGPETATFLPRSPVPGRGRRPMPQSRSAS